MRNQLHTFWLLWAFVLCPFSVVRAADNVPQKADNVIDQAIKCVQSVEKLGLYVEKLDPTNTKLLPVGLSQKIGNVSVTIACTSRKDFNGYSELSVFCRIKLPQGNEIYFGADNVKLSNKGGILGDAKLVLLGDATIPFCGNSMQVILKGTQGARVTDSNSQTYATFACGGVKEISISADVLFSKKMLVPLNQNLEPDSTQQVKGSFKTTITDWNDMLAEFSLQPFAVKGLEKCAITVDKAVLDFSDTRNSPGVVFPSGYSNIVPGQAALWRGVYVNKLKVTLPPEFKKKGSTERVSFEANQMLIDNAGLTGNFAVTGLLPEGTASGWNFSVDKFFINLEASKLIGGGFDGRIQLPVSKEQSDNSCRGGVAYKATIMPGNEYTLVTSSLCDIDFDLFQAQAHLAPTSHIELTVKDGQFRPKAVLTGSLTIEATKQESSETTKSSKSVTSIKGIEFQDLVLQTESPYIQVKYFGYKGEAKIGNFPISLSDIGLTTNNNEVTLSMGVKVNLMAGKISASTRLGIVGEMHNTSFVFKKLNIGSVTIDNVSFCGFNISGNVNFLRDDPTMGDGFAGALKMTTNLGSSLTVDAQAAFGAVPDSSNPSEAFRYWYVQAMASGFNVPVFAGISLTGLGGGASYHMLKLPGKSAQSLCGIDYTPDKSYGLGFNAKVNFKGAEALTGEAGFEMLFGTNMGLSNMGLYGKAYFAAPTFITNFYSDIAKMKNYMAEQMKSTLGNIQNSTIYKKLAENGQFADLANNIQPVNTTLDGAASMLAKVGMNYDFTNNVLHATAEAYIKTPGNVIRGAGLNNKAGWLVLHFEPKEWYVHIGTPTDPIGLKIGVGSLSAETDSYLMVGSRIPASPAPPTEVANILNVSSQSLDYMRELNALGDGKGFAFGSKFTVKTGDLRFLMFYANFSAGLGFDIMLKNYGNAHCEGSSEPIGINGWYANGQAYAYMQGELGIQVKLMFIKKRIPIISAGAALLLQAKLPNPTWFSGQMGGYFNVLGGLVKGKYSFKVTLGNDCKIVTGSDNPLDDLKIISDFTPTDKSTTVDVFTTPQAVFNMPVNKTFTLENGSTYRIKLDGFTVTKGVAPIPGKLTWNSNNDAVTFESTEILPPVSELKAMVSVSFEQQNGNAWQTVYDNGKKVTEQREITFTTGTAPNNIPIQNVAYCYPVKDQKYFFPLENSRQAYVQLKRGQAYLFEDAQYTQQVQLSTGGSVVKAPFRYDVNALRVIMTLPELKTAQAYNFTLAGVPAAGNSNNIKQETSTIATDGNDIKVTNQKAVGVVTSSEARTYLTYNFKTSQYYGFRDKMTAKTLTRGLYQIILTDVGALQANVGGSEAFDDAELWGVDLSGTKPLIQPVALLTDSWYTQDIKPRIYQQYPPDAGITISRDTSIVGFPPVRGIEAMTWYKAMSDNEPYRSDLITRLPYRYYQDYYYYIDFRELQNKVVNKYSYNFNAVPERLRQIFIKGTYPLMRSGSYPVLFRYILPGNIQSSTFNFEFKNPLLY